MEAVDGRLVRPRNEVAVDVHRDLDRVVPYLVPEVGQGFPRWIRKDAKVCRGAWGFR